MSFWLNDLILDPQFQQSLCSKTGLQTQEMLTIVQCGVFSVCSHGNGVWTLTGNKPFHTRHMF